MIELESKSEKDTFELGKAFGRAVSPGTVILLFGGLGSGKTVFVKGLAAGLGITDIITSPTYTIMQVYEGMLMLAHFDLYRLQNSGEFTDIGGEEYLYGAGVCAIEWPQKHMDIMPEERLEIHIENDENENSRIIEILPFGQRYETLAVEALA